MFLKLKHVTGPMVINTLHVIAMSPNEEGGTDIDLTDNKNITVENKFEEIWEKMKVVNPVRKHHIGYPG